MYMFSNSIIGSIIWMRMQKNRAKNIVGVVDLKILAGAILSKNSFV